MYLAIPLLSDTDYKNHVCTTQEDWRIGSLRRWNPRGDDVDTEREGKVKNF